MAHKLAGMEEIGGTRIEQPMKAEGDAEKPPAKVDAVKFTEGDAEKPPAEVDAVNVRRRFRLMFLYPNDTCVLSKFKYI